MWEVIGTQCPWGNPDRLQPGLLLGMQQEQWAAPQSLCLWMAVLGLPWSTNVRSQMWPTSYLPATLSGGMSSSLCASLCTHMSHGLPAHCLRHSFQTCLLATYNAFVGWECCRDCPSAFLFFQYYKLVIFHNDWTSFTSLSLVVLLPENSVTSPLGCLRACWQE